MTESEILEILRTVARHDLYEELFWRTDGEHAPITFWLVVNDVFSWGTADLEELGVGGLPDLEKAFQDIEALSDRWEALHHGVKLYASRRRKERPQGACYPQNRELWPLFDACGPERDTGLGNPYKPGEYKPGIPRVEEKP